jgi:hypothetical protein
VARLSPESDFAALCTAMLAVFPSEPPQVVADQSWGDYGAAREAFRLHGAHWSCKAIFQTRSILGFVNDDAFRFLVPRYLACSTDPDVFDCVVRYLRHNVPRFDSLFSPIQRAAIVLVLRFLHARYQAECGVAMNARIERIIEALLDEARP